MNKKLKNYFIFFIIGVTCVLFFSKSSKANRKLDPNCRYYQTMAYCGGSIKLACTTEHGGHRCQRYYCLIH